MKNKVWTPNGYQAGPVNSLVGKGESIINYNDGTGTLVTKGKKGVDNQPSSVTQYDDNVIAGNDIDWSNGMKFSDQVAPLTAKLQMYNDIEKRSNKKPELSSLSKQTMELQKDQLERAKAPILQAMKNITDRQEKQHQIEDYTAQVKANRGMDRFDDGKGLWSKLKSAYKSYNTAGKGKVSNSTIDFGYLMPAILEGKMLNYWMKERPQMPSIYASNKYAPEALQILNKMRVDPYNQLQANRRAQNEAYYRIQQNGGYSGGQRQLARIALAANAAASDANIFRTTDLQNNEYRSNYAKTALEVGNQEASRRQAANQYGWEAYNKAHGQKAKGIETHLANLGLLGQKWLGQRIKNKQYGDVLDMYQQELDTKQKAMLAQFGGQGGSIGAGTAGTGSGATGAGAPGNGASGSSVGANTGDLPILQPYYHNNGLGDRVFSINKPYGMPDAPALQRIPKGKYYMMPDAMPLKRYNSDQIRSAIQGNKETMRYADRMQEYAKGAYGAPGYYGPFTWDSTGGFGGNLLYSPKWAGVYFDYNKDSFGR